MTSVLKNSLVIFLLLFAFADTVIRADDIDFDVQLARDAVNVLNVYCKKCHGDDQFYPGLDMTNRTALLRPANGEDPFIVAGKPDLSRIWEAVDSEEMPPDKQPTPSDGEKKILKQWIAAGAFFPPEERLQRRFLGERTLLEFVDADLAKLDKDQIKFTRYFSIAHLWNDTHDNEPTTDEDLQYFRAALSKLLNSLSSRNKIAVPRLVDQDGILLAIDIRDYGWSEWHWDQVRNAYPYAVTIGGKIPDRVYEACGTNIPVIRADWFIFTAARPPLYHKLLNIPNSARTLESDLGVDIFANFQGNDLKRAAFTGKTSGVSEQNRLVERHQPRQGNSHMYWKSYDQLPGDDPRRDFSRSPLGPVFEQHQGKQLGAFFHDGGEIIYGLPNGLQGYMLVDGKDRRIDAGPLEVVRDPNQYSGAFQVVNGISCMGCHKHGMVKWKADQIRPLYENREGQPIADKVLKLFPRNEDFFQDLDRDRETFMAALAESVGPFLDLKGRRVDAVANVIKRTLESASVDFSLQHTKHLIAAELEKPSYESLNAEQIFLQIFSKGKSTFGWKISLDEALEHYRKEPLSQLPAIADFPDPISKVANIYRQEISLADAARELGLPATNEEARELGTKSALEFAVICKTVQMSKYGLDLLTIEDGSISRDVWEKAYPRVVFELELGTSAVSFSD